jgi:hypothetical protein
VGATSVAGPGRSRRHGRSVSNASAAIKRRGRPMVGSTTVS